MNAQPRRRTSGRDPHRSVQLALGALLIIAHLPWARTALAVDQPISGNKLWLKDTPKLVLLSKDAGIDVSGFDPRCPGGDSSLVIDDGSAGATFLLPCANWKVNGAGTLKYTNSSAPEGASAVKAIRVKRGLVKIIGKGLGGMALPNGDAAIDIVLNLDGISHRYCMRFTGTGDGRLFVAKDAPAGTCPSPLPCDATTGGFCWFLGDDHASCDAACAIKGRAYDPATETYAGSGGTDANCGAVLDALGIPTGPLHTTTSCFDGLGCFYAPPVGRVRCESPPTNASSSSTQRVCACQ